MGDDNSFPGMRQFANHVESLYRLLFCDRFHATNISLIWTFGNRGNQQYQPRMQSGLVAYSAATAEMVCSNYQGMLTRGEPFMWSSRQACCSIRPL